MVKNLILARDIPKEKFPGTRIVNIPGVTVTIHEMLDALRSVGGDEALELVEEKRDDATEKIVLSWPTRLDISRAKALGVSYSFYPVTPLSILFLAAEVLWLLEHVSHSYRLQIGNIDSQII